MNEPKARGLLVNFTGIKKLVASDLTLIDTLF